MTIRALYLCWRGAPKGTTERRRARRAYLRAIGRRVRREAFADPLLLAALGVLLAVLATIALGGST